MEFSRLRRFEKAYRRLSQQDQERVRAALSRFASNPLHPSLNIEKIVDDIWSFRVSDRLRCTFEFSGGLTELQQATIIELRNVGDHSVYRSL